ncbi:hypothetical protein SAMN02745244_00934 [Tessaracoccus bendigoensis DSM 12906]|uniref:Spore protein YkvP/CgeB glycosyl transferase-like domain-containing protein n=1 Tax=Tessaracoccus bendigoensis DSM 12906 TaxID=1123357 RepID=A0A1M6DJ45_9ACTN|nr:glycosyltransferase [Tessaracoccus bendigoensis]SHI73225.1 hypothetical protein SAMN02745244_00934 [Tessaracoccus bendigoensis DSM 12906]
MTRRNIVIYGDVNLNIVDGSAAWLASLAETLTLTDSTVHVVLKATVTTDRLLRRMAANPHVVLHEATPREGQPAMTVDVAVDRLEEVTAQVGATVLITRGRDLSLAVARSDALAPILWAYVTDFAFPFSILPAAQHAQLREIATRACRMFMQTEDSRSYLESIVPEAAGKTLLMTPTVPDDFFIDEPIEADGPLKLIYSGKHHPDWRTLEMLELPARLAEIGVEATLTVLGDKVSAPDKVWVKAMRSGLEQPPESVTWGGGLPREDAVAEISRHDVGLSWRTSRLDNSLEISTKLLEYAAAGAAPLLNRTRAHEALLGVDYPLFIDDDSTDAVVATLAAARGNLAEARATARAAARRYSSSATALRLESYFARSEPDLGAHPARSQPLNVVVAGHDLKFAGELLAMLQARPDVELRIDQWEALSSHDEADSEELLAWADLVICEWAGPNAVWYSQRVAPHQRLLVRLHRFELTSAWIGDIAIDKVDAVITVSEYYQDMVRANTDWPHELIHAIPNGLDMQDLNRPKLEDARFTLGLVGMVPFLKRPDRALDLLEALRARDRRFRLAIRGRKPWEYPWIWRKPEEQEPYRRFFERIGSSDDLLENVTFEPFGADMGNWLRRVGWVLSPSEHESFHLAPAEGMASGALPLFWPRDGVVQIFGDRFLYGSVEEMADAVLAMVDDQDSRRLAVEFAQAAATRFDAPVVDAQWLDLLLAP